MSTDKTCPTDHTQVTIVSFCHDALKCEQIEICVKIYVYLQKMCYSLKIEQSAFCIFILNIEWDRTGF